MEEGANPPAEANAPKAVKDKKCPYCHQAFTSSSLGRHLDLFIREKNPKAPDGVHDVEAIRRIRQNITRRQPKGSLARRATLAAAPRKSPEDARSPAAASPLSQTATAGRPLVRDYGPRIYPFKTTWEATGVINDIASPEGRPRRFASQQTLEQQLDARQQMQDAQDTARAAELALRELLGSLRAAKQHIDNGSMPFDFDPFSLDFPALTLQCLDPPPTLFASTQHATPTSWSILPPGRSQLEALHAYFREEFRKWKIACTGATTAVIEELTYPPPLHPGRTDIKAEVLKAEKTAEKMEKHVYDHLEATYSIWNGLAPEQREQLWRLELARGVGRKQKEVEKLKQVQHFLSQENASLKMQVEQLTRLQQPREFKIAPPSTVYFDEKLVAHVLEQGVSRSRKDSVGFDIADRHSDLGTLVSSVIGRWKNVVVAARSASSGLKTQLRLNTGVTGESSPGSSTGDASSQLPRESGQSQPPSSGRPNRPAQYPAYTGASRTNYAASAASTTTSLTPQTTTAPAVPREGASITPHAEEEDKDEEMSDQEAGPGSDAEAGAHAEGNAARDNETDTDGDADMEDGLGGYPDARFQAYQRQRQNPRLTDPVSAPQLGRLEVARSR
ncbi:74d09585-04cc-4be3-9945-885e61176121 [Thermothielavioides terrestris]|uniref:74d09585-04cc-4be3-9945-885e61176121 n=1 Tax=Thermothielavioides terrestris TaxID=2587410 RepID=A0A446BL80_9PEZI|nr:74d09585-04cc-4be3-9945-885e61176121 [Thermothielavioides terrestris]